MPSLDYLEDLKEKLEEDNLDYFMVVISRGKAKNNANVSYKLSKKHTMSLTAESHIKKPLSAINSSKTPSGFTPASANASIK